MTNRDVFVSFMTADKAVVDTVCARLVSAHDIRCRKSARDAAPGPRGAEGSVQDLERSRVMIFIFRGDENASMAIAREVAHAVKRGITILPLRIDEVPPGAGRGGDAARPWLTELPAPLEARLQHLADSVKALIDEPLSAPEPAEADAASTDADPKAGRRSAVLWASLVGAALVVAIFAIVGLGLADSWLSRGGDAGGDPRAARSATTALSTPATSPQFEGETAALQPTSPTGLEPGTGVATAAAEPESADARAAGAALSPNPSVEQPRATQPANPVPTEASGAPPAARAAAEPAPTRPNDPSGTASRFGRPADAAGTSGLTMSGTVFIDFLNSFPQGTVEVEIDGQMRWTERLRLTKPTGALAALKLQRASEQINSELSVPAGDHKVTVTILNGDGEVWDFSTTSLHVEAARPVTLRIRLTRFKNRLRLESTAG